MSFYDHAASHYAVHRRAEPRLTSALCDALSLPPNSAVVDVGAGTGKYAAALARRGYLVKAVEPSPVMRARAPQHARIELLEGRAEMLPLADASVAGAYSVIALCHFEDVDQALREMERVTGRGRIVIVTVDPREAESSFFGDYFPRVHERNLARTEPISTLVARCERVLARQVDVSTLRIPRDFADCFTGSSWARPELYLDADFRACASSFSSIPPATLSAHLTALAADLESGEFARRYPELSSNGPLDMGLRLLDAAPLTASSRQAT